MAINILPTRRNLRFKLDADQALTWHRDGLNVSQFLNTLSLFFPVGERFFIDSVRHYRDLVQDEDLKKAVTAFIGQEAMHGREHEEYNEHVASAGVPIEAQERFVAGLLKNLQKTTSPRSWPTACSASRKFWRMRTRATRRSGIGTLWRKPSTRRWPSMSTGWPWAATSD